MHAGVGDGAAFASDVSHYCRINVAGWGLGGKNLEVIPSSVDNAIDVKPARRAGQAVLHSGGRSRRSSPALKLDRRSGLDDVEAIVHLRDDLVEEFRLPYRPQVHADAVIG